MAETKWTPGPWSIVPAGEDEWGEVNVFDRVLVAAHRHVSVEGRTDVEANANARLIAAAPDLYAALEGALVLAEKWADYAEGGPKTRAIIRARAALARARGEKE
jgi:hypothetical protein